MLLIRRLQNAQTQLEFGDQTLLSVCVICVSCCQISKKIRVFIGQCSQCFMGLFYIWPPSWISNVQSLSLLLQMYRQEYSQNYGQPESYGQYHGQYTSYNTDSAAPSSYGSQPRIVLDEYNSDLNFVIEPDGVTGSSLHKDGFEYMWAGARATHGIRTGKVRYNRTCF